MDVSADWTVIDYEWTFPFPVPKKFVLYRAIYFAYYQIFKAQGRDLSEWLAMVDITREEAAQFAEWETHFQEYLLEGGFPVRNMQRIMGTKVIPFEELLAGEQTTDGEVVKESQAAVSYRPTGTAGWECDLQWMGTGKMSGRKVHSG